MCILVLTTTCSTHQKRKREKLALRVCEVEGENHTFPIHGNTWEYIWEYMGIHVFPGPWEYMGIHWEYMGILGIHWEYMGIRGNTRIPRHLGIHGNTVCWERPEHNNSTTQHSGEVPPVEA